MCCFSVFRGESYSWRLVGLLPIFDPPRDDTKTTLQHIADLGIRIRMITGDSVEIARETARQLGMGINILPAQDLDAEFPPEVSPPAPLRRWGTTEGARLEGQGGRWEATVPRRQHSSSHIELARRYSSNSIIHAAPPFETHSTSTEPVVKPHADQSVSSEAPTIIHSGNPGNQHQQHPTDGK